VGLPQEGQRLLLRIITNTFPHEGHLSALMATLWHLGHVTGTRSFFGGGMA